MADWVPVERALADVEVTPSMNEDRPTRMPPVELDSGAPDEESLAVGKTSTAGIPPLEGKSLPVEGLETVGEG